MIRNQRISILIKLQGKFMFLDIAEGEEKVVFSSCGFVEIWKLVIKVSGFPSQVFPRPSNLMTYF